MMDITTGEEFVNHKLPYTSWNKNIRHIGNVRPLCKTKVKGYYESLRDDLGYLRYTHLGTTELFRDQKPYRICKKCLHKIFIKENKFNIEYKHKSWNFYYKKD